jgi:hypothetical protein
MIVTSDCSAKRCRARRNVNLGEDCGQGASPAETTQSVGGRAKALGVMQVTSVRGQLTRLAPAGWLPGHRPSAQNLLDVPSGMMNPAS